jgi:hypothetical protein
MKHPSGTCYDVEDKQADYEPLVHCMWESSEPIDESMGYKQHFRPDEHRTVFNPQLWDCT